MSYLKNQATADKLLKKFGQYMTITSQSSGGYNTATGTLTQVEVNQTVVGAIFDWGTYTHPTYGQEYEKDSLIQSQDRQLILSAKGITPPNLGDIVTIGEKQYRIVPPLKITAPAGIAVVIICNIRGI